MSWSSWGFSPVKYGGQIDLVLVYDQSSLVGLCMQYYKSLCAAVMICASLVNIQTDRQTADRTAYMISSYY